MSMNVSNYLRWWLVPRRDVRPKNGLQHGYNLLGDKFRPDLLVHRSSHSSLEV